VTLADRVLIADPPLVGGGVLSLSASFPSGTRWQSGVTGIGTGACLEAGTHLFCPTSPGEKTFQGIDTFEFTPYAAEVSVECSTLSISDAVEARASEAVRARAEFVAGSELATGTVSGNPSLADATPTAAATDAVDALSILEGAIATTFGGFGAWVHVAPSDLVTLVAGQALWRDLAGWRTPGGHVVVSSPGYQASLAGTLVASTPVTAQAGSPRAGTIAYDRTINRRMAVFEVPVLAVFDPCGLISTTFEGSP
jgi:hypothetical protein